MRNKLMMVAVLLALAGCAAVPIHNVNQASVTTASNRALDATQVREAIVRAGAALGWQMKDSGSNALEGTLHLRTHTAVVSIPYSAENYSIIYKSSVNLRESDGKIHKNYNGWISNLTKGIDAQLSAL